MKNKRTTYFALCFFFVLTVVIFHKYFFSNLVPFPANLLVSFYAPWRYEQWKEYPNGPPNKPLGFDNLRFFYPLRKLSLEIINNKQIPLWNPYNFSGNVLLANSQIGIFYPLNILYFLVPQIEAWSLIIIVTPLLSLVFMSLYLKEIKVSSYGAFFGGIIWAFCGFFSVWMEENISVSHSSLWLPLILFSFEKFIAGRKLRYLYLMIFSLSFSMLAGHFQFTFYVWVVSFFYILNRVLKERISFLKSIIFFVPFLLAILVTSVHLVPVLEAQLNSPRTYNNSAYLFDIYLLPLSNLVTYVAPDWMGNPGTYNYFGGGSYYDKILYIGLIPLIFALVVILFPKKKSIVNFFLIVAIIGLLFSFKNPLNTFIFKLNIPFISTMLPSRILFLTSFSLIVLASFGFDLVRFKWTEIKRILFYSLGLVFVIFLAGWARLGYIYFFSALNTVETSARIQQTMFRNLTLPTVVFGLTIVLFSAYSRFKKFRPYILVSIVLLSFAHQYYFYNKSLYFSERRFIFPDHEVFSFLKREAGINRFLGVGNAKIMPNFASYYGIFSADGLDPLFSRQYGELVQSASNKGTLTGIISLIQVLLPDIVENGRSLDDWHRDRLSSLLGVKYIIGAKIDDRVYANNLDIQEKLDSRFTLVWENDKLRILQDKNANSRYLIAHKYVVETDKQRILDTLFDPSYSPNDTVILEESPFLDERTLISQNNIIGSDTIELSKYTPNEVVFDIDNSQDGLLYLSDNYYPGWNAYVDDHAAKIYRANYSFRAVAVPQGIHRVRFSYEPLSFTIGVIVSMVSLILMVMFAIIFKRREK